jgi:hypothetical protein
MSEIHALVHNALVHGDKVEPFSETDKACMEDLREVLRKHNKLDRFGVTLLHKHFDITDDEMLVETVDEIKRIQTARPMKKSEIATLDGQMVETCWSLQEGAAMRVCKRVCFQAHGGHHTGHQVNG